MKRKPLNTDELRMLRALESIVAKKGPPPTKWLAKAFDDLAERERLYGIE